MLPVKTMQMWYVKKHTKINEDIQTNKWLEGQIFSEFLVSNAFDPLSYHMASEDLVTCKRAI